MAAAVVVVWPATPLRETPARSGRVVVGDVAGTAGGAGRPAIEPLTHPQRTRAATVRAPAAPAAPRPDRSQPNARLARGGSAALTAAPTSTAGPAQSPGRTPPATAGCMTAAPRSRA